MIDGPKPWNVQEYLALATDYRGSGAFWVEGVSCVFSGFLDSILTTSFLLLLASRFAKLVRLSRAYRQPGKENEAGPTRAAVPSSGKLQARIRLHCSVSSF